MDREKQIEEMARELAYNVAWDEDELQTVDCLETAKRLYSAGYRKQSEGEWIRKDGFFVCSNCDRTKPFAVIRDEIHYYGCNYCLNCGAHMSGGKTDE